MVEGSCHCGAVHLTLKYAPTDLNDCQCGHCRKRGNLWAYYDQAEVEITGETAIYICGERIIRFHFCPTCFCSTHWSAVDETYTGMAINARLLEWDVVAAATVRQSPGPGGATP